MEPLILIVDDCEDDRVLMASILESLGYRSVTTSQGSSALQLVQRCQPALILLDICMPEMDGYEVVRHLRQTPQTAAIPVIAVTAMTLHSREQVLAAGFDNYLLKPFKIELFRSVIAHYFSNISNSFSIHLQMPNQAEFKRSFNRSKLVEAID